jgi:hypothetical protein
MSHVDEVRSPFLRKAIEQRGIADDRVTSLLIVERYLRHPEPTNFVALMLNAIDRDLPLEAAIVRREAKWGRSLTSKRQRRFKSCLRRRQFTKKFDRLRLKCA